MNWLTKFFVCTEKTVDVVKNNEFIISFLKEASKLSENSVDDKIIHFVEYLLDAKKED